MFVVPVVVKLLNAIFPIPIRRATLEQWGIDTWRYWPIDSAYVQVEVGLPISWVQLYFTGILVLINGLLFAWFAPLLTRKSDLNQELLEVGAGIPNLIEAASEEIAKDSTAKSQRLAKRRTKGRVKLKVASGNLLSWVSRVQSARRRVERTLNDLIRYSAIEADKLEALLEFADARESEMLNVQPSRRCLDGADDYEASGRYERPIGKRNDELIQIVRGVLGDSPVVDLALTQYASLNTRLATEILDRGNEENGERLDFKDYHPFMFFDAIESLATGVKARIPFGIGLQLMNLSPEARTDVLREIQTRLSLTRTRRRKTIVLLIFASYLSIAWMLVDGLMSVIRIAFNFGQAS